MGKYTKKEIAEMSKETLCNIAESLLPLIPPWHKVCIATSVPLIQNPRHCLEYVLEYFND